MTAATLTPVDMFYPGLKYGTASIADDYTTKFGLGYLKGVVITSSSDEDAIVSCAVSGGSGTIGAQDDAGTSITVAFTVNYIAWGTR